MLTGHPLAPVSPHDAEYEGIKDNIGKPEWKPDYGPQSFVPSWGCTAVGARMFLIAYNINLLGTKEQANRIAFNVREKGRGPDKPGRFKNVAGIGWYVDEYNMAQISVNCTDFTKVNIHTVFESCKSDAIDMNLAVAGSELVGLVPLECMLDIAKSYIEKEVRKLPPPPPSHIACYIPSPHQNPQQYSPHRTYLSSTSARWYHSRSID